MRSLRAIVSKMEWWHSRLGKLIDQQQCGNCACSQKLLFEPPGVHGRGGLGWGRCTIWKRFVDNSFGLCGLHRFRDDRQRKIERATAAVRQLDREYRDLEASLPKQRPLFPDP